MSPVERLARAVDACNVRDAEAVADLYAADGVVLDPQYPQPIRGRDDIRESYAQLFRSFPDATVKIQQRALNGGRVSYELRLTGTHTGPLATPDGEVPATGRRIDLPAAVFADVDGDGRFRETRRYYDMAELMRQLGLA
jgi:steroid delta-isomerase-like uncharacterized protein